MRQGPHSKRGRGRGGNRRSGTPNRNHTFDSNGPDVRIRGNAHQVHEKYLNLARDASTSGDRVLAESYFQHAEHYYRILSAFTDDSNSDNNRSRNNGANPEVNGNDSISSNGSGTSSVSERNQTNKPPDLQADPKQPRESNGHESSQTTQLNFDPTIVEKQEANNSIPPEEKAPKPKLSLRPLNKEEDSLKPEETTPEHPVAPGVTVTVVGSSEPENQEVPIPISRPRRRKTNSSTSKTSVVKENSVESNSSDEEK